MDKEEKSILKKVAGMVLESERPMPAYFTSNNGRKKSFCVDFNDLTAKDEYNMASCVHRVVSDFRIECKDAKERSLLVKIGEDMMIGSYIITKLGYGQLSYDLFSTLLKENKKIFQNADDLGIEKVFNQYGGVENWSTERYFEYCMLFGKNTALNAK